MTTPLLEVENVSKRFGATRALRDVSFDLRPGEVHALMGENGAGKSTLMKIVAGVYPPDSGELRLDGRPLRLTSPRDAMAAGIAIIHQELNTVPAMTVAENLAIGAEPGRFGLLDRARLVAQAREKLDRIGAKIDPNMEIGRLSVGMQQMVEIARAVAENAQVLVLDEPTASLSKTESEALFRLVETMREDGLGMVYISHRMDEVWQLADRVTVFRDGALVGTKEKDAIVPSDVVRMMVGREVSDLYVRADRSPGDVALSVRDLVGDKVGPVSFDVRAGELVGMVGLVGAGRTEVARLVYGADRATGGTVELLGRPVAISGPADGLSSGIGLLPESRKEQALFLDLSVRDNLSMSTLEATSRAGVLDFRAIGRRVGDIISRLRVRTASANTEVRGLSGGNQQKVVLGRLLLQEPKLLIIDEPTRGVDIGAKNEIYRIINDVVNAGAAVLMISSDLPEALGISDRLLVMRGGKIVAELDAVTATEEHVMEHATGVYASAEGAS